MNTTKALVLSIVVAGLCSLTGCQVGTRSEDDPVCLGFVIGARANSAPVAGESISALLPEQPPVGSVLALTGVSGSANGDSFYTGTVAKADNSYDQADEKINVRNRAVQAVDHAAASTPQADLLGAIEATAAQLRPTGLACTLHIFDSGLQTAGLIQFQQGLLGASVTAVLERIPRSSTLTGMTVEFHTLGATVAPQAAPDSTSLADLTAIWTGVIERRGGRVGPAGVASSSAGIGRTDLPPVAVVAIPEHTVDFGDITQTCREGSTSWTIPSDLLFAQGESELSTSAERALAKPAKILAAHPSARVTVLGYTSSEGTTEANQELSERRADSVKAFLQESVGGAVEIRAEGRGESDPAIDESGKTGADLESARKANRKVTVRIDGIDACLA